MREFSTPEPLRVDAYQAGHCEMIPPGMEDFQCSQAIYRKALEFDGSNQVDLRLISAGVAPFVKLNLERHLTRDDLEPADEFWSDFHSTQAPPYHKPYPWPRSMFEKIVERYDGRIPIVVTALHDGQAHYVGEPHVQIWTDEPGMGECVGWIESTLLPYLWTSSIVVTRGRKRKERMLDVYRSCYPSKTEDELCAMIAYKFHDFGRRGAAGSQVTGIAHLINWLGTDTVDAAYAATRYLNEGRKFGACSIAAAAHRTITPWATEIEAYRHMVDKFGGGIFSVVADSYNYVKGMEMLAGFAEVVKLAGGCLVGRPDSGDPVQCILDGLRIFADAFGYTLQERGLKVLENSAILQGDGVSDRMIFDKIYPAVIEAGFCPSNVAFGMGEQNHVCARSESEIAYKTCMVGRRAPDGTLDHHPVMKSSESRFKRSVPGPVALDFSGAPRGDYRNRVTPLTVEMLRRGATGDLVVHYDGRPRPLRTESETFGRTRERAFETWRQLSPQVDDTFSPEIRKMQEKYLAQTSAALSHSDRRTGG